MRKTRDYDSELAALDVKVRDLRARKVTQLGELVIACRADTLPVELLAGALLAIAAERDPGRKEEWRAAGEAMFREGRRAARAGAPSVNGGIAPSAGGALPLAAPTQSK